MLAANRRNGAMLTAAIRPPSMFGEDDVGWLRNLLDVYKAGKTNIQLGNKLGQNRSLMRE